ncbi:MAG: hypothetical protein RR061_02615 [Muribaculaceae bacterium]
MNENNSMKWCSVEFVERLQKQVIDICTKHRLLGGEFYIVDELNERWRISAPEYMANAVPEIPHYPTVAIAWACYYGMGAASLWDGAWERVKDIPDLYVDIRDKRGFDNLDDYVIEGLMDIHADRNAVDAENAKRLTSTIQDCAELAHTLIRKECIEPQSIEAFHMFAKTTEVFFKLGVSLALFGLGYKYEKMTIGN